MTRPSDRNIFVVPFLRGNVFSCLGRDGSKSRTLWVQLVRLVSIDIHSFGGCRVRLQGWVTLVIILVIRFLSVHLRGHQDLFIRLRDVGVY